MYSPCSSRYSDSLSNAASAECGVNCWLPSHSEYSKIGIVCSLCAPERDNRQIIILLAAEEVLLDGGDEAVAGALGSHGAGGLSEYIADAFHLKLLLLLVLGVGDAVGEKEDGVAGVKADRGRFVGDVLSHAEREAGQVAGYAFFQRGRSFAVDQRR